MGLTRLWYTQEEWHDQTPDRFLKNQPMLEAERVPLPSIEEILQDINSFMLSSVMNHNMGYLSILLRADSRKLLTITTQYGFFKSCVLPMEIKPASNVFQS